VEDASHHKRDRAAQRGVPPAREDAGALPTEDAALVLLFGLVAGGHIRLRKIDGWRKIARVLRQRMWPAA
jgi:hypothetical protein